MKLLAGLDVTAKSVERVAESIGADIAQREHQEIVRAVQLDLPMFVSKSVPILYVQTDRTGVPVVKKETTQAAKARSTAYLRTRNKLNWACVFTQTIWDKEGFAIRDPGSTTYIGAIENAPWFGPTALC
jgi:hypothetical protein